jgi:mannitol/fructose-specific phosphotransferase system IIA component (Ntr-type)
VRLSALLPAAQIRVPLRARTKDEAIDELIRALPCGSEAQREAARAAVIAREREVSTGIGRGVAVPHGRTSAVTGHLCAFGVARKPIDFDAIDRLPCRLLFLCVSPSQDAAEHVRVLSQLARVLNDPATRAALEKARVPEEVRAILLEQEAEEEERALRGV